MSEKNIQKIEQECNQIRRYLMYIMDKGNSELAYNANQILDSLEEIKKEAKSITLTSCITACGPYTQPYIEFKPEPEHFCCECYDVNDCYDPDENTHVKACEYFTTESDLNEFKKDHHLGDICGFCDNFKGFHGEARDCKAFGTYFNNHVDECTKFKLKIKEI